MKKTALVCLLTGSVLLFSCKGKESQSKAVVDEFLTEVNNPSKGLNEKLMSENFYSLLKEKKYFSSENWNLTVRPGNTSNYIVEARGKTTNSLAETVDCLQGFSVEEIGGEWKITDSYNFISQEPHFTVVDKAWDDYWDMKKDSIQQVIIEGLQLTITVPGYNDESSPDICEGKIQLINHSPYDVKGVKIVIEHSNSEGQSVNTSHAYVSDIIHANALRDVEWRTLNCASCTSQTFAIEQ